MEKQWNLLVGETGIRKLETELKALNIEYLKGGFGECGKGGEISVRFFIVIVWDKYYNKEG